MKKCLKTLTAVGFEPTPPKSLVPKTSALDHSATLPLGCRPDPRRGPAGLFSSVVEHWSRKPGVMGSIPIGGIFASGNGGAEPKVFRSWQGSNLRGQSPLDFKSNALTTRPQLHNQTVRPLAMECVMKKINGDAGDRTPGLSHAKRTLYH